VSLLIVNISPERDWKVTCYGAAKNGTIKDCSAWETVNKFRLFIAIEREKRKNGAF
jgi:hypothetical protein